ncbi:MAG: hypothetical protein KatS3mg036_0273 [Ignavibacterium sp.]|nr:MAG: hypothetical protein KatS3mg036_0273 [Ignavibacterium sp.]
MKRIETPFKVGDPIVITNGPFAKLKGTVQEVNNEKLKLKVMVSIFGRKTPVEIRFYSSGIRKINFERKLWLRKLVGYIKLQIPAGQANPRSTSWPCIRSKRC